MKKIVAMLKNCLILKRKLKGNELYTVNQKESIRETCLLLVKNTNRRVWRKIFEKLRDQKILIVKRFGYNNNCKWLKIFFVANIID